MQQSHSPYETYPTQNLDADISSRFTRHLKIQKQPRWIDSTEEC